MQCVLIQRERVKVRSGPSVSHYCTTQNSFFFCHKAEFTMCAMIRNPTQVSQSWTVGVNPTDLRLPWPFCSTP